MSSVLINTSEIEKEWKNKSASVTSYPTKLEDIIFPDINKVPDEWICSGEKTQLPIIKGIPLNTKNKNWFTRNKAWLWDPRVWEVQNFFYYKFIYRVKAHTTWIDQGTIICIPTRFLTDFASSPRAFWPLGMDPVGILQISSLVHDFGYRHNFYIDQYGNKIFENKSKRFHDCLFKVICEEVNEMKAPGFIALLALDVGGWFSWYSSKKNHDGTLKLRGNYIV